jgi:hypothetical protein
VSDGCEQRARFPAALGEGYFLPDETSFATRVAMSAGLASRLRFIDQQHQVAGTWGELFETDESLVMARIASTDLSHPQAAFTRDADSAPLTLLASQVLELAAQVDGWLKALKTSDQPSARRMSTRIEQLIAQPLAEDLHWVLGRFGARRWQGRTLDHAKKFFDAAWFNLRSLRVEPAHRSDREMLRARFFSFVSAIERLQDLARELLPPSLETQAHAPAAGLLMTFLQLHQVVQERINRFTGRHADFYYDDCLRMRPLPAVPDAVYLVCERDPRATREVAIARGTAFTAGKDALGQPIEFLADDPLVVTDARVAALLTLKLVRDPLISPEREFGYVTRAEAARLPWPVPVAAAMTDVPPPRWPLFGGATQGLPLHAGGGTPGANEEARIGLAIASPLLFLQEGEREITLTLQMNHPVETDRRLMLVIDHIHENPKNLRRLLPILFKRHLLLVPELLSELERSDPNAQAIALAEQALQRQAARREDEPAPGFHEQFLTELAVRAPTRALFFARLGRLFSRWLLAHGDWLTDDALAALRETADRLLDERDRTPPVAGDPRCLLQGPNRPERELIFGQLFNSILSFGLTTPAGWLPVTDFFVTAGSKAPTGAFSPLEIVLRLRPKDPAVTGCSAALHGPGWATELPVLSIRLRSQGRLYPYSLLEEMQLAEATLVVRVTGLRDVVLNNNLGRLDASKPFMPFGPLPTPSSYMVFGSPEMARKNVTRLGVDVEWSGLPPGEGGFATYYEAYGPGYRNGSFTATAGILRDGRWQNAGAPGSVALFDSADATGRLHPRVRLDFPETALRAHGRATDEPLDFKVGVRNGFYRIQLAGPAMAFGHQAYPGLLTEVVSANTLRRRKQQAVVMPNAPYTPVIENLSIDYEAQSHIALGREAGPEPGRDTERVMHIHPFGLSQVYPGEAGATPGLWPRFQNDGDLYIGLAAEDGVAGALTLHFHLCDEAAVESLTGEPRPRTHWAYLASNTWRPLSPSQVMSDTTCGFLTSGIVTLDVPARIDRDNTLLPADFYWLRLSTGSGYDSFAGLYGVRTQAVRARRALVAGAAPVTAPLPAGSGKEPAGTVFGLGSVAQIGPSFGMRAAEDRRQMRTRIGERLQHKQRASTPWDIERLVLERFPSVLKVKCFQNLSARAADRVSPGDVLVVVVPTPPTSTTSADVGAPVLSATAEPHLNAVELARIQEHLQGLASPFAQIQVRNAVYERIQVRCTVKLCRGVQPGQALRRVDQAITDYLSPWREGGYQPSFDWTIRCEDVEAHVRSLDCVDFVTQLSLLHVAQSDDHVYTLGDTARGQAALATRARPGSPWSIALPMREHMLRTVDGSVDDRPEVTGISRLGIGSTFIVGRTAT